MKTYEIVVGLAGVVGIVVCEALALSLSGPTWAMLGALCGYVLPSPSAMLKGRAKKAA